MDKFRFLVAILCSLVLVAVVLYVTSTPVPAETTQPKVTGKFKITTIKSFDAAGLPGLVSIQYNRVTGSPGTKIENLVLDDRAELCIPAQGSATITLPDGSTLKHKKGDIFTIPLGAKAKSVVFDPKLGWVNLCWFLKVK